MNENTTATPSPPAADVTGPRIGAALIDLILLGIVFFVMAALFGDSTSSAGDDGAGFSANLSGIPAIIYFLIVLSYYYGLELTQGQTIGKKLTKIKVVSVDNSALTPKQIGLRTACRIIDGLPFLYLLGFIVMLVSKKKQRIGDMAGKTIVVKA